MPSLLQNLPQGWEILPFSKCVNKISIKHKVKTKDYLKNGKYPIIDQAKDFISGYSNDENLLINIKKPVIVFGDHTRCFKFIDFNFIAGADGIKILSPIDEFNEKLFYYFCLALKFEDKGYSRHYQFLEKTNINIPPLEVQKAIVEKLENSFAHIDEAVHHLKAVQTNIPRLKSSLLHCAFSGKLTESQNQSHKVQTLKSVVGVEGETLPFEPLHPLIKAEIPQGWEIKTLGEVCEILDNMRKPINADERGQRLKKAENRYPYYGATGQVGYIDDYLCDFEAILLGEDGAPFLEFMKNKAYIVSGKYWVNNHAHILKTKENIANNKFICHFLNILDYTPYVSGTTRLKLNQSSMKQIKIPLPPLETQNQIVQILESKFAHLEKLAQFVNESLENLQRLKSSLLNQAFKGELIC
ncbi:restriction endonuclease subunit S [Helicobacter typhlonius]|uniref:restriction endonuclease subunit S n=1 Tax=Helicobacter typhlonius TaxID=76936 RepID=UPI002FE2CCF4